MKRLAALLLITIAAHAEQPFVAAVSGDSISFCYFLALRSSGLQWIEPGRYETPNDFRMIASRDGTRVYGIVKAGGAHIVLLEPDGTRTPFFHDDPASGAWALDVAPDGRLFVAMFIAGTYQLGVISPAGVLEASYPMPGASVDTSLAVGDDGCTVYYFTYDRMRRMNGCTGAVLPDFLIPPSPSNIFDVDPLPNGQVLVAIDDRVDLFDAAGTFVRTVASLASYGLEGWTVGQVIADANLSQVWLTKSGCDAEGELLRVSFANGAELSRLQLNINTPNSLILGAARTNDLPIGNAALLLLALGIAAVAVLRL